MEGVSVRESNRILMHWGQIFGPQRPNFLTPTVKKLLFDAKFCELPPSPPFHRCTVVLPLKLIPFGPSSLLCDPQSLRLSKRFCPELSNFLAGVLFLSFPRRDGDGQEETTRRPVEFVPPFKVLGPDAQLLAQPLQKG